MRIIFELSIIYLDYCGFNMCLVYPLTSLNHLTGLESVGYINLWQNKANSPETRTLGNLFCSQKQTNHEDGTYDYINLYLWFCKIIIMGNKHLKHWLLNIRIGNDRLGKWIKVHLRHNQFWQTGYNRDKMCKVYANQCQVCM